MLISHEAPVSILEEVSEITDIQYALVHLFETNEKYYNFFKKCILNNREVILDNSIFELGKAFDGDKFAKYVEELNPTYYIVPDVLEDGYETILHFNDFIKKYPDLPGLRIGVVQGKTYDEIVDCYKYMSEYADYIAISFDYNYYIATGLGKTELERWCNGRFNLINDLIADGFWNNKKPHHLLGCSFAKEFFWYKSLQDKHNIRSVDTSNPVVAGIKGLKYSGLGLKTKPSVKLADLIDYEPNDEEKELIYHNISIFKKLAK
jgi:hypothetical protein